MKDLEAELRQLGTINKNLYVLYEMRAHEENLSVISPNQFIERQEVDRVFAIIEVMVRTLLGTHNHGKDNGD